MNANPTADLPTAIFVAGGREHFHIYRGKPDEMVSLMAQEMGADSIPIAIGNVLLTLALHRRILIELPTGLDDRALAAFFVYALLDTKIARPLAQA
jgi:hypothetical protein